MQIQDLVQRAFEFIPGAPKRSEAPQLSRDQAMSARPIRNPALEWNLDDNGFAEVVIPRRGDLTGKALGWFFQVPEARPVHLDDELATFVWTHCDGEHTVTQIAKLMAKEHQVSAREMEASLTEYLRTLAKRGMVGFLVPDEIAEQLGEKGKRIYGLQEVGGSEGGKSPGDEPATGGGDARGKHGG